MRPHSQPVEVSSSVYIDPNSFQKGAAMRKTHILCILLLSLMTVPSVYAQENWQQYTKENGTLPNNEIRAIAEDANGVKWFGTYGGGVVRVNGDQWSVFDEKDGLAYNKARALAIDKDGVLWVGTSRGLSLYDGLMWTTYTTENSGLQNHCVISIAVDQNNVKWFGTYGGGLVKYDGEEWTVLTTKDGLPDNKINAIAFDNDGNVWVGTDKGTARFNGVTWTVYNTQNSGISHDLVFAIKADADDTIWFGTRRGVSSYDNGTWTVYSAKTRYNILDTRCIYAIDIDSEGMLWFGASVGMWSYDGENWTSYTRHESDLEKEVYIRALHTDQDGNKWIGTRDALTAVNTISQPINKKSSLPTQMKIVGNYPNPFNPDTTIEFTIPDAGHVSIDVYNITGQKIRNLVSGHMEAGAHSLVWDGRTDAGVLSASGVYVFRLEQGDSVLSHRMMMTR